MAGNVDDVAGNIRSSLPAGVPKNLMFQAQVVGWCIEWLQASFLVWDDIMDESVTRRGQPCWYKAGVVLGTSTGPTLNLHLLLKASAGAFTRKASHAGTVPMFGRVLVLDDPHTWRRGWT